jgi:tetrathionate reductase subunit B
MSKVFVVDVGICNGCYCCQIACKDEHVANDWSPVARPQPETGQFWCKMTEHIRGTVPKVKMHYIPLLCMHCDKPICLEVCPEGAIQKREDGLVALDPAKCTGCKDCMTACPYGAIYFNDELLVAQKCTGCSHLLDNGWHEPRCVDACPTGALKFGEEAEFQEMIGQAEVLLPEAGAKPRVFYLNIPRKFVAGTVYDPVAKEVLIGATCTLTDLKSGKQLETVTDGFGDFWFDRLDVGAFSLEIASADKSMTLNSISTEKDVNLGDLAFCP